MPALVAMLRGINVGGKALKMDQLRGACDRLGFQSVRTYIQSGNVVFQWAGNTAKLADQLEGAILDEFGLKCAVVVRSAAAMNEVLGGNPFLRDSEIDRSKLHVTFLSKAPVKAGLKTLAAIESAADRFEALGKEIYLYCPNGYGNTKLSNTAIEKVLSMPATTRNWNTVNKLCEMLAECGKT